MLQVFKKPVAQLTTLLDVAISGIANGQVLAYQASTGKIVPATPSGAAEAAYSENATGVVTGPVQAASGAFAAAAVAVPNTDITVTNSNGRPVYLDGFVFGQQTTAGTGKAVIEIWETTGTPAMLSRCDMQLPNAVTADSRRNLDLYHPSIRLGAVATSRSFQIRINTFGGSGTVAWQAGNINAQGFKSWLRAMSL